MEFEITDKLEEDVGLLKEWISNEPHLPKIEDDDFLRRCLHYNKYRIEKAKAKIDNYFSYKNKYPDVLKNRDPLGSDITQARIACNISIADRLTKDGGSLLFCDFHPDPSFLDVTALVKMSFMLAEMSAFIKHTYVQLIVDCKNMKYQHFVKGIPKLKMAVDIYLNNYSESFKGVHIINMPVIMEACLNTAKTFFPEKHAGRIFVHSSSTSLCEMVDEHVVCKEFGGKGPSLSAYDEYTMRLLKERRAWFLEQDNFCTNEQLRRKNEDQLEEMEGTFRKLDVD